MESILSLEDAINNESTTPEQKSEQLNILTPNARNFDQSQLEDLVQGGFGRVAADPADTESLKELAVYRIKNNLSIHPFSEYKGEVGPAFY
jgi:hypothetical protein